MSITDRRGRTVDGTDSSATSSDPNPGLAIKTPCRVATTANITLAGLQTIDGVVLSDGDRVLVKDQTNSVDNGVYRASSGNWLRATDWNGAHEVVEGTLVEVVSGETNGSIPSTPTATGNPLRLFIVTTSDPIVIGTTAVSISEFALGPDTQAIEALTGSGVLARTGTNTWALRTLAGTSNRLTVTNGNGVSGAPTFDISASYVGQSTITTLGTISTGIWNGTAITAVYGGTGLSSYTLGDIVYSSSANTLAALSGNTSATRKFLRQTGTGAASAAPAWDTITAADIPASALTKVDDTNVKLTLGGTPTTALLSNTSITVSWSGTLAASRGGFAADISASSGVPLFAAGVATFTSTTGSANFVRATAPTITNAVMSGTATFTNNGIRINDTDASHNLVVVAGSNLTADRNLTITTGDAARSVTFSGDVNFTSTFTTGGSTTLPAIAQGDLWYGSAAGVVSALAKDTGTSKFLKNSGTSNNPAWVQPAFTDLSGSVAASQMPALTGDVTTSAGAVATTIGAGKITAAMTKADAWSTASGSLTAVGTPGTFAGTYSTRYIQRGKDVKVQITCTVTNVGTATGWSVPIPVAPVGGRVTLSGIDDNDDTTHMLYSAGSLAILLHFTSAGAQTVAAHTYYFSGVYEAS